MAAFSKKPWSDFSQADYSIEQWKSACLINMGGDETSKDNFKLPVKEPNGDYNANGIHAAAGAHGVMAVNAPADEKRAAAKKIISLYKQMDETAPENVYRCAGEKMPAK